MLRSVCIVWGIVDCTVGVTGACGIDILGISHHAVRIQYTGCSKGGDLRTKLGYTGVTRELSLFQ